MMKTDLVEIGNAVVEAQAWRISFHPPGTAAPTVLATIKTPDNLVALAQPIDFAQALKGEVEQDPTSLLLLCLPPAAKVGPDIETQVEAWLQACNQEQVPFVRAGLRTSRVVWTHRRAAIYAAREQLHDAIDAVLRFTIMARQTSALEHDMAAAWPKLEAHAPLTHKPSFWQRKPQREVNRMTITASRMKGTLLRVQTALEQLDPTLSAASKRLCAELILQGGLYDRLEMLEEPIDFSLTQYELANTRLMDSKTATTTIVLESLIVLLLLGELCALLTQILIEARSVLPFA
jgi:hypothetical protein